MHQRDDPDHVNATFGTDPQATHMVRASDLMLPGTMLVTPGRWFMVAKVNALSEMSYKTLGSQSAARRALASSLDLSVSGFSLILLLKLQRKQKSMFLQVYFFLITHFNL